MGMLNDVVSATNRGLRAATSFVPGMGGAATPPETPLPTITGPAAVTSPNVPNPAPSLRSAGPTASPSSAPSVPGGAAPGATPNPSSPTGSTFQSANPAVEAQVGDAASAPAAEEAGGLRGALSKSRSLLPSGGLAKGLGVAGGVYSAVDAAKNGLNTGNELGLGGGVAAVAGLPVGAAAAGGLATGKAIYDHLDDPTQNVIGGTINQALSNIGLGGVTGADKSLEADLNNRAGGDPRLPVTPGNAPNPAQTNIPVNAPIGLRAPTPATPASIAADPTKVNAPGVPGPTPTDPNLPPGISRTGNSFTNLGPDGQPTLASQTSAPTGIDLGLANARTAAANAIRASTPAPGDAGTLFNGAGGGNAIAVGSPQGSDPRMQVSNGDGIGGLIAQKAANHTLLANTQAAELGLRNKQFGANLNLDYARLGETQRHNAATVGVSQQQLQREGLRDANTSAFQRGELANKQRQTDVELAKFGASHSLAVNADQRAQIAESDRIKNEGQDKFNKLAADTLPVGPDGKVDQDAANFHTSSAQQGVADRINVLKQRVAANPNDAASAAQLSKLSTQGMGALDDSDRARLFAGANFAHLAQQTGTGAFTPWGSTDVQSRSPATSLTKISRLTGDVYRDQLGREVPARLVEKTGSTLGIGGTRNAQFDSLITKQNQQGVR